MKRLIQIRQSLLSKSREILSVLAILLFVGNYHICEFFYKDDLVKWWDLRTNIYAIIFGLGFQIAITGSKGWLRFFLSIGLGFSISDIIDRVYFDINTFTNSDYIMIGLTLLTATYNLCRKSK